MAAINKRGFFILIARLVLVGVFVMAALPKIQDPVAFASSVAAFRVMDSGLSGWVALLLPWMELIIGLGLLIQPIRLVSGALMGMLLLLFIALHASAWIRGLDISCGCFGAETGGAESDYRWLILRNALLLGATIVVLKQDCRNNGSLNHS
jgi:uncharacterized membrane protein YphA (DoxX/SURF4 family)